MYNFFLHWNYEDFTRILSLKAKKEPRISSNPSGPGSSEAGEPKPNLEALDGLRPTDDPQGGETVRSHQVNFHCWERWALRTIKGKLGAFIEDRTFTLKSDTILHYFFDKIKKFTFPWVPSTNLSGKTKLRLGWFSIQIGLRNPH